MFMRIYVPSIVLALLSVSLLHAQPSGQRYEVGKLNVVGNEELTTDQLLSVIQTRETPWVVWKWIYHRFDKEILGGQKPEYFDPITFAADYRELKRYYAENGFIHSKVDTTMMFFSDKVNITLIITEGRRSHLDTVRYVGFEALPSDVQAELLACLLYTSDAADE